MSSIFYKTSTGRRVCSRRTALRVLLGAPVFGWVASRGNQRADAQTVSLNSEQAQAALHCPDDASRQFVDDCFTLVHRGKVPESVLLSAFQYAISQRRHEWKYFQENISMRCARLKIDLAALRAAL